jgi:hypothetical protein
MNPPQARPKSHKPAKYSRSQIIQKFFGSFFQKRTERKHFFFEKKKQKTFDHSL